MNRSTNPSGGKQKVQVFASAKKPANNAKAIKPPSKYAPTYIGKAVNSVNAQKRYYNSLPKWMRDLMKAHRRRIKGPFSGELLNKKSVKKKESVKVNNGPSQNAPRVKNSKTTPSNLIGQGKAPVFKDILSHKHKKKLNLLDAFINKKNKLLDGIFKTKEGIDKKNGKTSKKPITKSSNLPINKGGSKVKTSLPKVTASKASKNPNSKNNQSKRKSKQSSKKNNPAKSKNNPLQPKKNKIRIAGKKPFMRRGILLALIFMLAAVSCSGWGRGKAESSAAFSRRDPDYRKKRAKKAVESFNDRMNLLKDKIGTGNTGLDMKNVLGPGQKADANDILREILRQEEQLVDAFVEAAGLLDKIRKRMKHADDIIRDMGRSAFDVPPPNTEITPYDYLDQPVNPQPGVNDTNSGAHTGGKPGGARAAKPYKRYIEKAKKEHKALDEYIKALEDMSRKLDRQRKKALKKRLKDRIDNARKKFPGGKRAYDKQYKEIKKYPTKERQVYHKIAQKGEPSVEKIARHWENKKRPAELWKKRAERLRQYFRVYEYAMAQEQVHAYKKGNYKKQNVINRLKRNRKEMFKYDKKIVEHIIKLTKNLDNIHDDADIKQNEKVIDMLEYVEKNISVISISLYRRSYQRYIEALKRANQSVAGKSGVTIQGRQNGRKTMNGNGRSNCQRTCPTCSGSGKVDCDINIPQTR